MDSVDRQAGAVLGVNTTRASTAPLTPNAITPAPRHDQGHGRIRSLSTSDSRLIAATQRFSDPCQVLGALLENSLDSGASEIVLVLEKAGLANITVSDDGCGISADNLQLLGRQPTQPGEVASRAAVRKGESLFLVSALGSVIVTTSTGAESHERDLSESGSAMQHATRTGRGTTVAVKELYKTVPVRQKYFTAASLRRRLTASSVDLIHSYALACYKVGFRLIIDGTTHINLAPAVQGTLHDRHLALFDQESGNCFGFFSFETRLGYAVNGSMSKPSAGFSKQLKQVAARKLYLSVNGQPVLCPAISEAVQQAYNRISATTTSAGALELILPQGSYAMAKSTPYYTLQVQGINVFAGLLREEYVSWLLKSSSSDSLARSLSVPRSMSQGLSQSTVRSPSQSAVPQEIARSLPKRSVPASPPRGRLSIMRTSCKRAITFLYTQAAAIMYSPSDLRVASVLSIGHTSTQHNPLALGNVVYWDIPETQSHEPSVVSYTEVNMPGPDNTNSTVRIGAVARRGEFGFHPSDFLHLQYICQYNKSFLVAQLLNTFFLVDQHAAHECKKFNNYWNNPSGYLSRQRSIKPIKLELRPDEHLCVKDFFFSHIFETVGFGLQLVNDQFYLTSFPSVLGNTLTEGDFREYLLLLYEYTSDHIAGLLKDSTSSEEHRDKVLRHVLHSGMAPTKFRAIFASKSCKTSVRLGDPLKDSTAEDIIRDLVYCKQPFNCPHGRPVLRLLSLEPRTTQITFAVTLTNSQEVEFIDSDG